MEFFTKDLRIGPFRPTDAEAAALLLTDRIVGQTYMLPEYTSPQEALPLFQRLLELSQTPGRYVAGIYLEDHLIGLINETEVDGQRIELGYALLPAYHNRGYATQALTGAIAYLFAQGFAQITAGAFEENIASLRVMGKSGMERMDHEDTVNYRGKEHRCIYYHVQKTSQE